MVFDHIIIIGDTYIKFFNLTFDSLGRIPVATIYGIKEDSFITKPTDPTKNRHNFYGWYTDKTYKYRWNFNIHKVN